MTEAITLNQAQEQYEEFMAGAETKVADPGAMQDVIAALKAQLKELKFQYLQQESRDKFLRQLGVDTPIRSADVEIIRAENDQLKLRLKLLKTYVGNVLEESRQTALDVVSLNERYETKLAEFEAMQKTGMGLEEQLAQFMQLENETFKDTYNMRRMLGERDPEAMVGIVKGLLDEETTHLRAVEAQVDEAKDKLSVLSQKIEDAEALGLRETSEREAAEKVRAGIDLFSKFCRDGLVVQQEGEVFDVAGVKIRVGDKIECVLEHEKLAQMVNSSGGPDQFRKLLALISATR